MLRPGSHAVVLRTIAFSLRTGSGAGHSRCDVRPSHPSDSSKQKMWRPQRRGSRGTGLASMRKNHAKTETSLGGCCRRDARCHHPGQPCRPLLSAESHRRGRRNVGGALVHYRLRRRHHSRGARGELPRRPRADGAGSLELRILVPRFPAERQEAVAERLARRHPYSPAIAIAARTKAPAERRGFFCGRRPSCPAERRKAPSSRPKCRASTPSLPRCRKGVDGTRTRACPSSPMLTVTSRAGPTCDDKPGHDE